MPGLFDLISSMAGRPDPSQQIAAALGQGPGQAGGPPASPMAPPGPPAGGAPGGAPGGASAGASPPPPQPQAYTSPPDLSQAYGRLADPNQLMNLYVQLAQRQAASEQFNHGLAMIAGSFGPLATRAAIMRSADSEPTGMGPNDLMNLVNMSYQLQQRQALMQGLPKMLSDAGISQDYAPLVMANPGLLSDILKARMGVTGDPAERALQSARADWLQQNPGKTEADMLAAHPEFSDAVSYAATKTGMATTAAAEAKAKTEDQAKALSDLPDLEQQHSKVEGLINQLLANPDATTAAVRSLGPTTGKLGQISANLGILPQGTADAASNLTLLGNILYSEGWKGRGNRLSQQEAGRIGDSFTSLNNANLSPQQIVSQLNDLKKQEQTAHGNALAAAGSQVPSQYWPLVNSIYKKGGDRFAGATPMQDQPAGAGGGGGETDLRNSSNPDADYDKLPSGATFIGPDGQRRRKP